MAGGIKEWPEDERPREKLLKQGAGALSEAELLALIIRTGDAGSGASALDIGRGLISRFGDLRALAGASAAEICSVRGMGPAKAACIQAALELGARFKTRRLVHNQRYTSPEQVFEHFHFTYRDRRKEYFLVLLLDGKNRIIREVQVSEGSLNQSIVHPREVFHAAVRESAAGMILIHNHPTGDPTPSREDINITERLTKAGEMMGVKVLDHVIIGDGTFTSFVSEGLL